jgi:hypothetical protein
VTDITYNYNKDKLVFKMIEKKLPVNFVKLLHSNLTDRTLQVKVQHTLSEHRPIKAGFPQGSILGPE